MAIKRQLQKQWEAINNSLADLEGELLQQLDEIEYELGQGLQRWELT